MGESDRGREKNRKIRQPRRNREINIETYKQKHRRHKAVQETDYGFLALSEKDMKEERQKTDRLTGLKQLYFGFLSL